MNRRITARAADPPESKANAHETAGLSLLFDEARAELSGCESIVQSQLKAFYEAGKALLHIQNNLLYRAEFRTFEDYCRNRWGMSWVHAYRLVAATEVIDAVLSPMGNISLGVPSTRRSANRNWSETAHQPLIL